MIDLFAIALTHGLLLLCVWRLLARAALDADPVSDEIAPDMAPDAAARPASSQAPLRGAPLIPRLVSPGDKTRA